MRDELILDNINLVYFVIKQLRLRGFTDDLYDIGLIGLVGAANTYDESKGYKFNTYAIRCIRNEILVYMRKLNTESRKANFNALSLNNVIRDDDGREIEFIDTIPDDFDMEEYVLNKEKYNTVSKAIKTLSEREKLILKLYYGKDKKTQKEIAKILNTSQANVSRLVIKIVKKLKEIIKEKYE